MLIEKIMAKLQAIMEIARHQAMETEAPPAGMATNYPAAARQWARFEWDAKAGTYKNQQGSPTTPEKIRAMLKAGSIIDPPGAAVQSPTTPPVEEVRYATELDGLEVAAQRIVAAFELEKRGVTSEMLVAGVLKFEKPYTGVVQ